MSSYILRQIDPELWRAVKARAALEGVSIKLLIEVLLRKWLQSPAHALRITRHLRGGSVSRTDGFVRASCHRCDYWTEGTERNTAQNLQRHLHTAHPDGSVSGGSAEADQAHRAKP